MKQTLRPIEAETNPRFFKSFGLLRVCDMCRLVQTMIFPLGSTLEARKRMEQRNNLLRRVYSLWNNIFTASLRSVRGPCQASRQRTNSPQSSGIISHSSVLAEFPLNRTALFVDSSSERHSTSIRVSTHESELNGNIENNSITELCKRFYEIVKRKFIARFYEQNFFSPLK